MNRNDMRALVRLVVVSMAAYIVMSQLTTVLYMPIMLATYPEAEALPQLIPLLVTIGVLVAAVWLMLWRSDRIAQWLMRPLDDGANLTEACVPGFWLPAAFRIACVLGGLVFLLRLISRAVPMILYLVGKWRFQNQWHLFGGYLLMLAVGVYLLCGAPRFVRWHVEKTLELCGERPDNTPVA